MAEYKLIYFSVKGRSSVTRYMLEDSNVKYTYEAISLAKWAEYKASNKPLFGQLPCLRHGDLELYQSSAIARYIASRHGLVGADDRQRALIDMLYDSAADVFNSWAGMMFIEDNAEHETKKVEYKKSLPDKLKPFETVLSRHKEGKEFFVGDKISLADFAIFDLLEIIGRFSPDSLAHTPLLKAFAARIASRASIALYLERLQFV